jgi:hypothetical protein
MVSALSKPLRISLLLALAVIISFALTTLYVSIMHGRAVHSHVIHRMLEVLIACSCIPFVYLLPVDAVVRTVIAVALAFFLYFATDGYVFWLACAGFESCP